MYECWHPCDPGEFHFLSQIIYPLQYSRPLFVNLGCWVPALCCYCTTHPTSLWCYLPFLLQIFIPHCLGKIISPISHFSKGTECQFCQCICKYEMMTTTAVDDINLSGWLKDNLKKDIINWSLSFHISPAVHIWVFHNYIHSHLKM